MPQHSLAQSNILFSSFMNKEMKKGKLSTEKQNLTMSLHQLLRMCTVYKSPIWYGIHLHRLQRTQSVFLNNYKAYF